MEYCLGDGVLLILMKQPRTDIANVTRDLSKKNVGANCSV